MDSEKGEERKQIEEGIVLAMQYIDESNRYYTPPMDYPLVPRPRKRLGRTTLLRNKDANIDY